MRVRHIAPLRASASALPLPPPVLDAHLSYIWGHSPTRPIKNVDHQCMHEHASQVVAMWAAPHALHDIQRKYKVRPASGLHKQPLNHRSKTFLRARHLHRLRSAYTRAIKPLSTIPFKWPVLQPCRLLGLREQ